MNTSSNHESTFVTKGKGVITLVKRLGKGAAGSTMIVRSSSGDYYVRKLYAQRNLSSFDSEVKVLNKIKENCSEFFVCIKESGIDPRTERPYILIDYVNGAKSLSNYMNSFSRQKISLKMGGYILERLILGLQKLHSIGVVHKDIKEDNVIISLFSEEKEPIVKYIDYDMSCVKGDVPCYTFKQKPFNVSPEIIKLISTSKEITWDALIRNDIWGLVLICYQLCFGKSLYVTLGDEREREIDDDNDYDDRSIEERKIKYPHLANKITREYIVKEFTSQTETNSVASTFASVASKAYGCAFFALLDNKLDEALNCLRNHKCLFV